MKAEVKKTLMKIGSIVLLVLGIIYCCTIVGIAFGVLCFIARKKFVPMVELSPEELDKKLVAKENFAWSIVSLVILGVAGLLIFLPYVVKTKN